MSKKPTRNTGIGPMWNRRTQARNSLLFHDSIADWVRDRRAEQDRNHEQVDSRALIRVTTASRIESTRQSERAKMPESTNAVERAMINESTK